MTSSVLSVVKDVFQLLFHINFVLYFMFKLNFVINSASISSSFPETRNCVELKTV